MDKAIDETDLVQLRRHLHAAPELSGREENTARELSQRLEALGPDELITGLGGHGVAAVFEGASPGRCVLLRSEMDALPIEERSDVQHRSNSPGIAHLCGHDGHMAMLYGAARRIAVERPSSGRFIALFQPAEETGAGGPAVAADPRFRALAPDLAFALHNLPGESIGEVHVRAGSMNCASRGMEVSFRGRTSHAAHPEDGKSPALAMCELVRDLTNLEIQSESNCYRGVTVVHAQLGEAALGTSPGDARGLATLRTERDDDMARLVESAIALSESTAARSGLAHTIRFEDVFDATTNSAAGTKLVERAADEVGLAVRPLDVPLRWSEDFGVLIEASGGGALIAIGSGVEQPQLHAPDYDFPDELIPHGVSLFEKIVRTALNQ